MKILMVLTSHDVLGSTGLKTGFWLEEFAAPYFVFRDAGVDLTLASPKGGSRRSIPRAMCRRIRLPRSCDSEKTKKHRRNCRRRSN